MLGFYMRRRTIRCLWPLLVIYFILATFPVLGNQFFSVNLDEGTFKTPFITIKSLGWRPFLLVSHSQDDSSAFLIAIERLVVFIDTDNDGYCDKNEILDTIDLNRIRWNLNYSIVEGKNLELLLIDLIPRDLIPWPGPPRYDQMPHQNLKNSTLRIRMLISSNDTNIDGIMLSGLREVLVSISLSSLNNPDAMLAICVRNRIHTGVYERRYSEKRDHRLYTEIRSGAAKMYMGFSTIGEFDGRFLNISVYTSEDVTTLTLPRYEDYGEIKFIFGLTLISTGEIFSSSEIQYIILSLAAVSGTSLLCFYASKRRLKEISKLLSEIS